MRIAPVRIATAAGLALAASALGATPSARSEPPPVPGTFHLLRPDPRLCPSPRCGGYHARLANRAETPCHDGSLRPQCYVALVVDEHRHPSERPLPAGALTRSTIEPWRFEGAGELGVLVVARTRTPVGATDRALPLYRLHDTRIRCVRAPCFWARATLVNRGARTALSGVDLRPARPSADDRARADDALRSSTGLFASGTIARTGTGGRRFTARVLYLPH